MLPTCGFHVHVGESVDVHVGAVRGAEQGAGVEVVHVHVAVGRRLRFILLKSEMK